MKITKSYHMQKYSLCAALLLGMANAAQAYMVGPPVNMEKLTEEADRSPR